MTSNRHSHLSDGKNGLMKKLRREEGGFRIFFKLYSLFCIMDIKENVYKASGYYGRFKAAGSIVFGVIFFIVGIILMLISGSLKALVLSGFGLLAIIYGWILWKRCKSLLEGRFW